MFSFAQISKWLSFPADPLTVEDWLANREVFGAVEKPNEQDHELEIAFQTEQARNKTLEGGAKDWPIPIILNATDVSGIVDALDYLLIIPNGVAKLGKNVLEIEISQGSDTSVKTIAVAGDLMVIPSKAEDEISLKIHCREGMTINKKSEATWRGVGKTKIVIDTRGRPLPIWTADLQSAFMKKLFKINSV